MTDSAEKRSHRSLSFDSSGESRHGYHHHSSHSPRTTVVTSSHHSAHHSAHHHHHHREAGEGDSAETSESNTTASTAPPLPPPISPLESSAAPEYNESSSSSDSESDTESSTVAEVTATSNSASASSSASASTNLSAASGSSGYDSPRLPYVPKATTRPRSRTSDDFRRNSMDGNESKLAKLLGSELTGAMLAATAEAPKPSSVPILLYLPEGVDSAITHFSEPGEPPPSVADLCNLHYPKFEEPDSEDNVKWMRVPIDQTSNLPPGARDVMIRGGNVYKLIQFLTHQEEIDLAYTQSFLISYSAFMTGTDLLDLLVVRFFLRRPLGSPASWVTDVRAKVRLRVISMLKMWASQYNDDFSENPQMMTKIKEILALFSESSKLAGSVSLEKPKERAVIESAFPQPVILIGLTPESPIRSILDMHPEEMARQIALIEWDLWKKVRPKEFIGQNWNKPARKETHAPNISKMIMESNRRTCWAITEIVHQRDLKDRAVAIHRLLLCAEASFQIRNFNAVMEIISALQNSAVHRLKNTWEILSPAAWDIYDKLTALFDAKGNFQVYRDALKVAVAPCLPYLGSFLTDIIFAGDGNPDKIPQTDLINFVKYRNLTSIIKGIQVWQNQGFSLATVPAVQNYLINAAATSLSTDACYDISQEIEPANTQQRGTMGKEAAAKRTAAEKTSKEVFSKEEKLLTKSKKAALKKEKS
ncbi:Ras guanine nucleotide exchange factor [Pelomyxa schiedti]|nr:Ras guanine nucleotide exchange factor [Pelomyxa schiedti]